MSSWLVGVKHARRSKSIAPCLPRDARLQRSGDDLLEWRVASERIGQLARLVGSAQPNSIDVGARLPSLYPA